MRQIFEAQPDPESLLSAKLVFLTNIDLTNTTTAITALTLAAFWDTLTGIVEDRGSSALWFYPSCVYFIPFVLALKLFTKYSYIGCNDPGLGAHVVCQRDAAR